MHRSTSSLGALAVALVACGSPHRAPATPPQQAAPTTPVSQAPPATPPPVRADLTPPAPAIVATPQTRPPIASPHGGSIALVAATPDGTAAHTVDDLHGVRLWPALDGSQEPYVVSLPPARELALGKRAGGFTAVALDDVGGLIINALDPQGRLQTHATLAAEPAYTHIVMSDLGLVALRSDQAVLLIGDDGQTRSILAAEAGQQIVDVLVRGTHAYAVIETTEGATTQRRGRELMLAPKLAWGAFLGAANSAPDVMLAVSPSGRRIAWLPGSGEAPRPLTVLDLGKQGAQLAAVETSDGEDVEFLDDDHVVYANSAGVFVIDVSAASPAPQPVPPGTTGVRQSFAIGGGRVIAPFDGELVIVTPKSTSYLGYAVQAPTLAAQGPKGQLVVGLALTGALLELDDKLEVAGTPNLKLAEGDAISEIAWLGDTHWAMEVTSPQQGTVALELADTAKGTVQVIRGGMKVSSVLSYEPATNLLTLSFGDSPEVYRYDPRSHALSKVAGLPASAKVYEQTSLLPVAPKLSGGIELVRLAHRDQLGIQWLRDPRALDKAAYSATADSFAAADASGRVYAWRAVPGKNLELDVFDAGKVIATLPADGPVGLWPDPSGARVLEIGQRTVALYTGAGKLVWTQQLVGSHEAYWVGDDAVAVISAAGVARLDARTGAVQAARCGWSFGLSPKPHPTGPQIEPVCAQLDR